MIILFICICLFTNFLHINGVKDNIYINMTFPYDIYRWKCENEILYKQASLYISESPNDIDEILKNVEAFIRGFDTHYWISLVIHYDRMTTFSYPEGNAGEGICYLSVDELQLVLVLAKVHF
uniref:Uncharacterized protein n=1 Tax=Parastrongyloides trichosuri TaxID=131310 RepID=A0A0N5A2J2_PARTI